MIETLLQHKIHDSLILKDQTIISPFLSEDLMIIGAKPNTVKGNSDKELFQNLLDSIKFGGDPYYFKSNYTYFTIENKMKKGLEVEYYVMKERWAKLDVYFDNYEEKINKLYLIIKSSHEYFGGNALS